MTNFHWVLDRGRPRIWLRPPAADQRLHRTGAVAAGPAPEHLRRIGRAAMTDPRGGRPDRPGTGLGPGRRSTPRANRCRWAARAAMSAWRRRPPRDRSSRAARQVRPRVGRARALRHGPGQSPRGPVRDRRRHQPAPPATPRVSRRLLRLLQLDGAAWAAAEIGGGFPRGDWQPGAVAARAAASTSAAASPPRLGASDGLLLLHRERFVAKGARPPRAAPDESRPG